MSVGERDSYTGKMTTGHEWNGIKELNTPVPKIVLFFLSAAFIFAVACWILLPAWPLGLTGYSKGLLGVDERKAVAKNLQRATAERAPWTERIINSDHASIRSDKELMRIVRQTGHRLFGDNCGVCHGLHGQGGKGYPAIARAPWQWGGDPETLEETIRVGINSSHPESRASQMIAFGHNQILQRQDILNVAAYVLSLSKASTTGAERLAAGKSVFEANCVSCHGDDARGKQDFGAPNLTDAFWIYGGDPETVYNTIYWGRQGQMPSWESRLSAVDRKILALYLLEIRAAPP